MSELYQIQCFCFLVLLGATWNFIYTWQYQSHSDLFLSCWEIQTYKHWLNKVKDDYILKTEYGNEFGITYNLKAISRTFTLSIHILYNETNWNYQHIEQIMQYSTID